MKWKKVSEYPLPNHEDGKTKYLIKFSGGDILLVLYPSAFPATIEWCEFNPDEIESANDEHSLETLTKEKLEKIFDECNKLSSQQIHFWKGIEVEKSIFDELDSLKKRLSECKKTELSWEEKFRWETARDDLIQSQIVSALRECSWTIDNEIKRSISLADTLIKELKRGRE